MWAKTRTLKRLKNDNRNIVSAAHLVYTSVQISLPGFSVSIAKSCLLHYYTMMRWLYAVNPFQSTHKPTVFFPLQTRRRLVQRIYRVGQKSGSQIHDHNSVIWTDLKKCSGKFLGNCVVKWILKLPPHLAYVATLPCETSMSAKQAISDKL